MRRSRSRFAWLLALTAACGDGDDQGSDARELEGTWLITSVTLPTPSGLTTLRRDGVAQAFRGDAVFTATGDDGGRLDVRQVVLTDGLIASDVMSFVIGVTLEPGRWILTEAGGVVTVYQATRTGEQLHLALDPDDPRTTAVAPTTDIVVARVPAWTTAVVGEWDLVSMQLPAGTVIAGACTEVQPGTRWAQAAMTIAFTPRLLFERVTTLTTYGDAGCTSELTRERTTQRGLAEEEGARLQLWGVEDDRAEYLDVTLAIVEPRATLTRTACLPRPDCLDEAPLAVVVERR